MNKRLFTLATAAAGVAVTAGAYVSAPASADVNPVANSMRSAALQATQQASSGVTPAVFIVPHQDDETLSMGAAIINHVKHRGADNVFLWLYTDGGHTSSRKHLSAFDGEAPCGYGDRYNQVCVKNVDRFRSTQPNLRANTSSSRDKEFIAAALNLGLKYSNIHFYANQCGRPRSGYGQTTDSLPSGCTVLGRADQQPTATKAIQDIVNIYGPHASYKTQSDFDPSPEHRYLGVALRALKNSGNVVDARFYYPQYQREQRSAQQISRLWVEPAESQLMARWAGMEYGYVNLAAGRYGIGYVSVPHAFGGTFPGGACNIWVKNTKKSAWQQGCDWFPSGNTWPILCTGSNALCKNTAYLTGKSYDGRYGPGTIHSLVHT